MIDRNEVPVKNSAKSSGSAPKELDMKDLQRRMDGTLTHLKKELGGLRGGKPDAGKCKRM